MDGGGMGWVAHEAVPLPKCTCQLCMCLVHRGSVSCLIVRVCVTTRSHPSIHIRILRILSPRKEGCPGRTVNSVNSSLHLNTTGSNTLPTGFLLLSSFLLADLATPHLCTYMHKTITHPPTRRPACCLS